MKKAFYLLLSLGIIIGQTHLLANEDSEQSVTTKLINQTKYKLWLQSEGESVRKGVGSTSYDPLGEVWVDPGETLEKKDKRYAPTGTGLMYYTKDENADKTTLAPSYQIELDGKNKTYNFSEFDVEIEAKPVTISHPVIETFEPKRRYHYFNYIIKVTGKTEKTENINRSAVSSGR